MERANTLFYFGRRTLDQMYYTFDRLKLLLLIFISSVFIVACGGDDDDNSSVVDNGSVEETFHIVWEGSTNGEWVTDMNGDFVRFENDSPHYMEFGSTTYENVWVDEDADLWMDGIIIGGVEYITSEDNDTIVGLVGVDGTFLDIFGSEDDLTIVDSDFFPTSSNTSLATSANKAIPLTNMSNGTMTFQSLPTSQRLLPKLAPNASQNSSNGERKRSVLQFDYYNGN